MKIPTADEFADKCIEEYQASLRDEIDGRNILVANLKEFAALHREAMIEAIVKKVQIDLFIRTDGVKSSRYKKVVDNTPFELIGTRQMYKVNKLSVINAYPEENII